MDAAEDLYLRKIIQQETYEFSKNHDANEIDKGDFDLSE